MNREEGEEIALISKGVLDVDTNAGHEGVESTALWPDRCLSLQHRLDEVRDGEGFFFFTSSFHLFVSVPKRHRNSLFVTMAARWIKTLRRIKVAGPETMQIIIEAHYSEQCQDNSVNPAAISICRVRNQKEKKHLKIVYRFRH